MSATDFGPSSPQSEQRSYQLPWGLELVLSAGVVLLAGYWCPINPRDPDLFIAGFRLWFAITIFFLWITGLRVLRDRSTIPSAGELLGLGPFLYWLSLFTASCITPDGELTLPLFLAVTPIYFGLSLFSCAFLVATVAGKRQHVVYKFIDVIGLLVNIGGAVLFMVTLWLHPFVI